MDRSGSALTSANKCSGSWQGISTGEHAQSICALLVDNQMGANKYRFHSNHKNRHGNSSKNGNGKTHGHAKRDHGLKSKFETMQVRKLLAASLDALDVGLEIWDDRDQLVLYNEKINRLQMGFHIPENIGAKFEDLLRANLQRQLIKIDSESEETWLAQRMLSRGKQSAPILLELADDRWANTYETRTPENYLVVAWVDVTELVRKGRVLEAINRELAHQSTTDGLTGLANRRRFDEVLACERKANNRISTPISLLMVDIDYFKKYNDYYGHSAGDECLRRVAALLDQCVRRTGDLVARYGGEEFVILLPGSDLIRASEIAQQCLDLMQDESIPHLASPIGNWVSLSIGVACLSPDTDLVGDFLLNAADAALYRAKSKGRACFEVASLVDWNVGCQHIKINVKQNETTSPPHLSVVSEHSRIETKILSRSNASPLATSIEGSHK